MADDRVARVEWGLLEGKRPVPLGRNARLPPHGSILKVPLCRLTTGDGLVGLGPARVDIELAYEALGCPISRMFGDAGTERRWLPLDYPLWDLAARRAGVPVYQLANGGAPAPPEPSSAPIVRCYDTSLYFQELEPRGSEPEEVAEVAKAELPAWPPRLQVKVGRGARWMGPAEGLDRDVAVIGAVREAIGEGCALFADANNGYTLNGACEFLAGTASARLGWLEEPFNEDPVLLEALRAWIAGEGLDVMLADCESASAEEAYKLASGGFLDVVQCDILRASFTGWLWLGKSLDSIGIASAPHHFGLYLGNYVTGHLAGAVKGLSYIEWDEAAVPGLTAAGYHFSEGRLQLSDEPGFGIELDDEMFDQAVHCTGFDIRITRAF